jgi:phospholipase/carboxylesterase
MNRIRTCSHDKATTRSLQLDLQQGTFETSPDGTPHSLFAPLHYERNYAYPLLIWLHGPGDNENQLKRIMPLVSMRNYVGVAPRGTWSEDGPSSSGKHFAWRQHDDDTVLAEQRVVECIRLASERFHIHRRRVFLAGYDCGGTMAFRLGLNRPDLFAGVLSVGGAFPRGNRPLIRFHQCRDVPLFLAHCRESRDYPAESVCEDLRLFHTAGMSITLRQYPCGDEITTQMLSDMDSWIMEQVTGAEPQCAALSSQPPTDSN